jgi:hypothetical protein
MPIKSEFADREKKRLLRLGGDTLYSPFREGILRYYREHSIAWWGGGEPTQNPISSQIACINHLEPTRLNRELARIAKRYLPDATDVLEIEDGFIAYEWIGMASYLGERGWSPKSRGRNITSVDALMPVKRMSGRVCLILIEWKYTECYSETSLAVSKKGTSRINIYRPLLEHPHCPIQLGEHERLFFDPYDQLMRQTLLAWQMVEHKEFGATEWLHLHIAPGVEHSAARGCNVSDARDARHHGTRVELRVGSSREIQTCITNCRPSARRHIPRDRYMARLDERKVWSDRLRAEVRARIRISAEAWVPNASE